MTRPEALYHFTCSDHGLPGIERLGLLVPNPRGLTPTPVVWLTDDPTPDRHDLGLTSLSLSCDRMEVRCVVENTRGAAMPWAYYCAKRGTPVGMRDILEFERDPSSWWVSEKPLKVAVVERVHGRVVA